MTHQAPAADDEALDAVVVTAVIAVVAHFAVIRNDFEEFSHKNC